MLRIGIIGMGGYAAEHWQYLEAIAQRGACQIVATAVIDPENHTARLEQLAQQGVEIFRSAEDMFDAMQGRMDAVTIPTSIHTHPALMIAAVSRGYHVYLEKPPAATVQEVDEMIAAARGTGRIVAVGFQALWSPAMALLKLRVEEGAFGTIETLACSALWIRRQEYFQRNHWAGRLRLGGAWVLDGPSNNALSHQITNMLYLASPQRRTLATPSSVRAEMYRARDIEAEDIAAIEIRTAEGPRCYFLATLAADDHQDPEITIIGDKASAYLHYQGRVAIRYADGRVEEPTLDHSKQYSERFENFIAAAEAGDKDMLICSLEMCRPFTVALNGAYESSRRVRPIDPGYVRTEGDGPTTKTTVEGLDAAIATCASQGVLLSDLGLPWATPTEPFDTAGYNKFPVRFEAGQAKDAAAPGELPFG